MHNNSIDKRIQKLELKIITATPPIPIFFVNSEDEKLKVKNDNNIVFTCLKPIGPYPIYITKGQQVS